MDHSSWDRDELKRLAETSGKPLEVEVASIFDQVWRKGNPSFRATISLGSYFIDPATEKYRELDVLVDLPEDFRNTDIEMRPYVLCSCKGFPIGVSPVTYSMAKNDGPDYSPPTFMCSQQSLLSKDPGFGTNLGNRFLIDNYLGKTRRFVGFDTIAVDTRSDKISSTPKLLRKGDRDLFLEGWDSAVKASLYWADLPSTKPAYARLLVPVLVLPKPWWDFPICDGKVSKPDLCDLGYTTTLYPMGGNNVRPRLLTTLVVSVSKLSDLAESLKFLVCHFGEQVEYLAKKYVT